MDTSLINSQTVELLSRITGQNLSKRDITPQVIFLASLVTVLLGVIFVDGTVAEQEKQRLLKILYRFSLPESGVRRLTHLIIKGVKDNQIYKKNNDLLTLTAPLSESEKLLLIGFGYEISAADGEMDSREKKYLEIAAQNLGIKSQHLAVLETGFTHQGNIDSNALNEVHFLLNPARFHELDFIFVQAASDMLAALPAKPEIKTTRNHTTVAYEELKKFQAYRQQLDNYCYQVFQIIQECQKDTFLPHTLIEEVSAVSRKLQSQRFRLAVVGEFSQGKSTLLNALLGEEIQPVRAIPCSGTVTVLKYGTQKRVICRYKDGRNEEIPFDQYKVKATISKEAALDHRSDELAESDIEEIIFEHPELALCKSGVEIVDSPGLNEHPQRTAITQKILTDTDAAIFLTHAMRLLSEKEKELLSDVRYQLNNGSNKEPSHNLFVLVNFMDMLDKKEDIQDVKHRLESFVKKENLLASKNINRVHYISAKAALNSIQQGNNDEYLRYFQDFTQSLERFLTQERGIVKINRAVSEINRLIQKSLGALSIAENSLDGKIKLSNAGKKEILEKIGEASGCDIRIRNLVEERKKLVIEETKESWDEWHQGLENRITRKSKQWFSQHNPVFSQDKLIKDYTNQFIQELSRDIDEWGNQSLKERILQKYIQLLNADIAYELDKIEGEFHKLDQQVKTNFSKQINISITEVNNNFMGFGGIGGGLGIGGALAAGLVVFAGIGFIAIIVASVATALAGALGLGMLDIDGIHHKIKKTVCQIGLKKFREESKDKVYQTTQEIINAVFHERVKSTSRVIAEAISLYENLIEQQEKVHQETLEQREAEKAFIYQKRQELERVQNELEIMINKSTALSQL
ncbi:dynamin family protein [Cylindrospermum sp. NIES-4074]|nr:dynamin family protein [Cylindrospermum sp. NIES-4074]